MLSSYAFQLPADLIAQSPPQRRGDARMLLVEPGGGVCGEIPFREIVDLLRPGDRLVLNESRVLPARLQTIRTDTGGRVEILLLRPVDDGAGWLCMARPARRLRPGVQLKISPALGAAVTLGASANLGTSGAAGPVLTITRRGTDEEEGQIVISCELELSLVAQQWGVMPLPPYIQRKSVEPERAEQDRERYQTVYAAADPSGAGSVAAPTAGLHFSRTTLDRLTGKGIEISRVRLHVGPGTFQPPSDEQIAARRLHREFFQMPASVSREISVTRANGGRVIAVGTTALRVLETVARLQLPTLAAGVRKFGPGTHGQEPTFTGEARAVAGSWEVCGETRLFVAPPDSVSAVDGLLTNFHLPESSLLMLVASLMGADVWRRVYEHAVRRSLRFYSYGDCMLILPQLEAATHRDSERV